MDRKSPLSQALSRFVATSAQHNYPADVIDLAKMCLADWLAVALGALDEPAGRQVARVVSSWCALGPAPTLYGSRQPAALAALVNATLAHCLDYDDVHFPSLAHLSAPTWAATLAIAGDQPSAPGRLLQSFVTGFEIGARLGSNGVGEAVLDRGWHSTGVVGRIAATAATCAYLGLSERQVEHAIGIAATQTSGLTGSFGTDSKPLHAGKAAFDGIFSAQLSAGGFRGATDLLDREHGLIDALVQQHTPQWLLEDLGETWEIRKNALKPYACCGLTHAAIDSGRHLAASVHGKTISSVTVRVHPLALKVAAKTDVVEPLEAKFSLAFCTALGLLGHRATAIDFSPARIGDPGISGLARLVHAQGDARLAPTAAQVTVAFSDGATLSHHTEVSLGNPGNPMSWEDLREKFLTMVEPVLGASSHRVFDELMNFEHSSQGQHFLTTLNVDWK